MLRLEEGERMESQSTLDKFKGWGLFIVAVFLALLLIIVGVHLMFFDPKLITPVMFYLIALCFFAGAVLMLMSTAGSGWFASAGLGILSLYSFGRATGLIDLAWLAILAGVACWVFALILLYLAYPSVRARRA